LVYYRDMSWASRRRIFITAIIALIVLAAVAVPTYLSLSKAPTCTDGELNGEETGVDCGGVCARVCLADVRAPKTEFVRAIQTSSGRTDVISYIDNPNGTALGARVPYELTVYDENNRELVSLKDTITLLPGRTPLYVPNIFNSDERVARAFISFTPEQGSWSVYRVSRPNVAVETVTLETPETTPRLVVVLHNRTTNPIKDLLVVATHFDSENNIVGASQTVVPSLAPDGTATAYFTWNEPFAAPSVRQEIVPVFVP